MNIYNIDEIKLSNLRITSYVILNVEYFWTDERVRKLCQAIYNQQEIRLNLDLFQSRSCTQITDECFKYFGQLQPNNLLELSLSNWGNQNFNITDAALIHLGKSFKSLKVLRLNLNQWGHKGCQISNMGITSLFQAIPESIVELDLNLNKLGYRNSNISGFILVIIGQIIQKFINLQQLTLNIADWGCDYNKSLELFNDEEFSFLIDGISTLNLEKLHLDLTNLAMNGSKITGQSAQYLLESIKNKEIYDFTIVLQGWLIDLNIKNVLKEISMKNQQKKKLLYQWQAINQIESHISQRMLQKVFEKL